MNVRNRRAAPIRLAWGSGDHRQEETVEYLLNSGLSITSFLIKSYVFGGRRRCEL